MATSLLEHLSHGRFNFLRSDPAEIRRALPTVDRLATPEQIFLENEKATPLVGFPLRTSRALAAMDAALGDFLQAEENAQFAYKNRDSVDTKAYTTKWERYRGMLAQALRNAIGSSFGSQYPDIFWLYHSQFAASYFRGIPKRLLRMDLTIGREHGDEIKYKVFQKWVGKVLDTTYDVVHELAEVMGDKEETLFPSILTLMRDNVLIFTEEHISPDLSELSSYFNGYLRTDGRDLRQRLRAVREWHAKTLPHDEVLRSAVIHLLRAEPDHGSAMLLNYPGYLSFLSSQIGYSDSQFPTPEQIKIWEGLLLRLQEFELLQALRKMMVPIEVEDDTFVSRDRSTNTTWVGGPPVLRLSSATRPIDFTSPWVVDPLVHRFGLVYDISDFSATISLLGRAEKTAIGQAFRMTFDFQRKINLLGETLHLRLEKYLGDGAFYSGRHPRNLLIASIHLQRLYTEALKKGFPFDRGLRIAINFGEYRLLPLDSGALETTYEYFGHGLVELSRLTTGKKTQEIDEFKTYLIGSGYPEKTVTKFFEPMMRKSTELVSKDEESRPFFAYINPNSALINEGIVATEPYLSRLGQFEELYFAYQDTRGYIVVPLVERSGETLLIGLRKLGFGKFKGLEPMPIFEILDGASWQLDKLQKIPTLNLLAALEKVFASRVTT
jgi:hypothetical protein